MSEIINAQEELKTRAFEHVKSARKYVKTAAEYARKAIEQHSNTISQIHAIAPDWFIPQCDVRLFVRIGGGRADFTRVVTEISKALDEAPSIRVEAGQFMADFEDTKVHLYLMNPTDCQLIEVEEIVKRMKPHPSCVAALKELEEIA